MTIQNLSQIQAAEVLLLHELSGPNRAEKNVTEIQAKIYLKAFERGNRM